MSSFDHLFEGITKTKFEPCLDHRRRAQILALLRRGIKPTALARMYSVNRHTVQSMGRESSPHYRPVRREYAELGRDAFEAKYLEESVVRQALALQRGIDEETTGGLRPDQQKPSMYNRRANSRVGRHHIADAYGIDIEVEIAFGALVDNAPEAWYYQESGYDTWAGPYFTSSAAYNGARLSQTQEQLDGA